MQAESRGKKGGGAVQYVENGRKARVQRAAHASRPENYALLGGKPSAPVNPNKTHNLRKEVAPPKRSPNH